MNPSPPLLHGARPIFFSSHKGLHIGLKCVAAAVLFTASSQDSQAATITYVAADNQFNNTTTVGAGGATSFTVLSTSGIGTASYTINYQFTADLSMLTPSMSGPTAATTTFSVTFTPSSGTIPNQSTVGHTGGASNNIDIGESVTATISHTPSYHFPSITFGAIQSYGNGDMQVGGVTKTAANPVFGINATSFTIANVGPEATGGNIGFAQFRVTAQHIPEPSRVMLMGVAVLGIICRRRRPVAITADSR